ncbi:MAG: hypothetical protein Q7T76_00300 [Ferruginibacter sp.]|nr:hypothetical protein [Ferruginibacter sp.]
MDTVPVVFEYRNEKYYGFFESGGGGGSTKGDNWNLLSPVLLPVHHL